MKELKDISLADLLTSTNDTIRRNSISIYKTLVAIDKKFFMCKICKDNDTMNESGICVDCADEQ